MKILILTIGSRGDVQPFVALGEGLQKNGHDVLLATATSFEEFVRGHGLNYAPLPNDLVALLTDDMGRKAVEELQGFFGAVKVSLQLLKTIKPIMRELMKACWYTARDFGPDIIIYHSKIPGAHIAERLGVPAALVLAFPQMVATSEFPTLGMPELGRLNKATYKIVQVFIAAYGGFMNEFRTKVLGLEKTSRFMGLHHMADGTPIPVLHCYSENVVPRPKDWPECAHVTGYWFLEDKSEPADELVSFLDNGDPPVYLGFGSMSGRKPEKVSKIVVEALLKTKVRGIIATGWGGLEASSLPDSILKIEQAPHEWLFPRVSAVVHHGGAGTTGSGLRAGRPTIICPFFGDQPFWGKRIDELGVGSRPIPQKKLTVANLSEAIREVTGDRKINERAAALGDLIRREHGVKNAVELIESFQ